MRRFYNIYQFAAPLALFPLAYWLWLGRLDGRHELAALILFVPVVFYYLFVTIGILRYRLWRMNTRPSFRGIRPHHGFVIATACGLLMYLILWMVPIEQTGMGSVLTTAFLGTSVFGFWNWIYETYAVKSGFISLYTKKAADGVSAEEMVTDYAPVFFGAMGACYGAFVKTVENLLLAGHSTALYWLVALMGGLAMIAVPTGLYLLKHRLKYGESGLRSYVDVIKA